MVLERASAEAAMQRASERAQFSMLLLGSRFDENDNEFRYRIRVPGQLFRLLDHPLGTTSSSPRGPRTSSASRPKASRRRSGLSSSSGGPVSTRPSASSARRS